MLLWIKCIALLVTLGVINILGRTDISRLLKLNRSSCFQTSREKKFALLENL